MNARKWKTKINKAVSANGTDPKKFAAIIDTLSAILEQRDDVYTRFIEEGAEKIVEYTNKSGATNAVKNPLLILWMDLNAQALAYWRELGLTPSAYKKITGDKPAEKGSALVEALKSLGA